MASHLPPGGKPGWAGDSGAEREPRSGSYGPAIEATLGCPAGAAPLLGSATPSAEVVVGEQRGTDRRDPHRHLVHRHCNAVLDFGHGVMQNVAGVVDVTHSDLRSWAWAGVLRGARTAPYKPVRTAYLTREARMADTTAAPTGGRALFVRQSSGLVREVSVRNALFYNTAAFIGITVAWAPLFYTLAFAPVGKAAGLTSYAWAAILVGICCVFLGLIFASLATVMPRSGGDYVFTSRLIPVAGPFLAWVESFTLVFASLAIIAFEIPIVLRNTQISGEIIGIGTGSGFFKRASGWFTSGGTITDWPGMIGALVVIALILLVVIQPTRRFHRIVTGLGAIGLLSWVVMWVGGLAFVHRSNFEANLPKYTGTTAAALQKAATGVVGHGFTFSTAVLPLLMSVVLFQYIGFQYSAYIAGEVRGNIKRGILLGVLGALFFAVVMNSFYVDTLGNRLGTKNLLGWGFSFWQGKS